MKKRVKQNLKLSKRTISDLNKLPIKGGRFSEGCTDGCTPFQTWGNCTRGNCSADCGNGSQTRCLQPPLE